MRLRLNLGILICILLMAQTAFAYAEYAEDGGTVETTSMPSISPANGGSNIVILQQLIEADITNAEYTVVRETIIFSAMGNYTTDLMSWIPDGSTEILISRQEMTEGTSPLQLQYTQEGNIIRFNDAERLNTPGMPPMYAIEYVIPRTAEDKSPKYTKFLQYPTYINYPVSNLLIKIISAEGMEPIIKDEGGNVIQGDNIETNVNEVVHTWSAPQFKEFTVETKTPSNIGGILPYIVIGLVIIAILAFPFVQKKMKSENDEVFVESASTFEEEKIEEEEENDSEEYEDKLNVDEDATVEKPDLDELETRYDAILSLLSEIKADRDNEEISDEEYKTLSRKYKSKAVDLMKAIDELQDELEE
ncbi:MAG: hypothetical protein Q7J10_01305 [Methanosarcinaceae archaeon]|nr:hypothetical protein [Methanosarcinaceae archaeon]